MRSPYSVLGVEKSARDDDIKAAYRQLAKVWHPDQNPSDPKAAEVFAEINNAYQLLIDNPRRKLFDSGKIDANGRRRKKRTILETGINPFAKKDVKEPSQRRATEPVKQAPRATGAQPIKKANPSHQNPKPSDKNNTSGKGDYSDMISHIFGSEEERVAFEKQSDSVREENYHKEAMSVLDDAFTKFQEQREANAYRAPDRHILLDVDLENIFTGVNLPVKPELPNSIKVHIPAGTADGSKITMPGAGDCRKGEIPGDIVVTVRYRPNEKFWIRNGELHTHLVVDLADAVLGGEVVADTPEGKASFHLPEWTSSNHIIRIPNRGLPKPNGDRGDLCANVCILLPEKPDEQLKDVLMQKRKSWFV